MRILVDADACPVKNTIERLAKLHGVPVIMFIDDTHVLNSNYSKIVTVSKGNDSADFALINEVKKGDVIITQDYGVAALALAKQAYALDQNGHQYTNENIDRLLFTRHINKKARMSGLRISSIKKRNSKQDIKFHETLQNFLNNKIP